MFMLIILIAILLVSASVIGVTSHRSTPSWVYEVEALNDAGVPAVVAMATVSSDWDGRHPKDARCRRMNGGCYVRR